MPRGGGMFSPHARQQQSTAVLSPVRSSASSGRSQQSGTCRQGGMLLVAERAERRQQAEREARRRIAADHAQQLRAQISQREAAAREEQQRSHAAERTAIPAADRPWGSRVEPKRLEPVPWAQHADQELVRMEPKRLEPAPWAEHVDQAPVDRRPANLKRVLVGEGELVESEDAVWDTAQGIWRKGGSPHTPQRGNSGGCDPIETPEGWTVADQQRLADERAARVVEMESRWSDGMSNISDALSELLDSLTVESLEPSHSPVEPETIVTAASKAMPVVLVSRDSVRSKGKRTNAAAHGNTHGLLYHRDAQCPVPNPVETKIASYAKIVKGGGVVTRGIASFMGVKQVSGKVNDHAHVIQPIRISGPDNRQLPKGYSSGRRSGSAGLPPPPERPLLPSVKVKTKKQSARVDNGEERSAHKSKPSIPNAKQERLSKNDELAPDEISAGSAATTNAVTPAQPTQLATMSVADIGADDSGAESDSSASTPAASSCDEHDEETTEEEGPAAKATRLQAEAQQQSQQSQQQQQWQRRRERQQSSYEHEDSLSKTKHPNIKQLKTEESEVDENSRATTAENITQASDRSEPWSLSSAEETTAEKSSGVTQVTASRVADNAAFEELNSMAVDGEMLAASRASSDDDVGEFDLEADPEPSASGTLSEAIPPSAAASTPVKPSQSSFPIGDTGQNVADKSVVTVSIDPVGQDAEREQRKGNATAAENEAEDVEEAEQDEHAHREQPQKDEVVTADGALTVTVPEGSAGGDIITIVLDDGREMEIEIPANLVAGDEFEITIEEHVEDPGSQQDEAEGVEVAQEGAEEEEKEKEEEEEKLEGVATSEPRKIEDEEDAFMDELTASLAPSRRMTMGDKYQQGSDDDDGDNEHRQEAEAPSDVEQDEPVSDDELISSDDNQHTEEEAVVMQEGEVSTADAALTVTVPEGSAGGDIITIVLDDGREMEIEIPANLVAGDEFEITIEEREQEVQEDNKEKEDEEEEEEDGPENATQARQAGSVELTVFCPMGSHQGDLVSIATDSGEMEIVVPEGVDEGDEFQVEVPIDVTDPLPGHEEPSSVTVPEPTQPDAFGDLASIMAEVEASDDSSSSSEDLDLDAMLDI